MPFPETYRPWILLGGAVLGYLLVMFASPVRASLRDGLRCMARYPALWAMLTLFGLCYAVFQLSVELFSHYYLQEGARPVFIAWRPWFLPDDAVRTILKNSRLPALEGVAGIFNVLITTFPFSSIAALLFLVNWDGHHGVLFRALRRRFDGLGWVIYFGILLCAVAALVMPLLYGPLLLVLDGKMPGLRLIECSYIVVWLSFLFELMFGVCVQIYLILMVYAWVRGLNFTRRNLLDFAIRRFSFVMKWSGIVMLLSTLFISLPQIITVVPPFTHYVPEKSVLFYYNDHVARPLLVGFLLLFSGMQIILTFHSETLRKAFGDYLHFLRKDGWAVFWFLVVAFIHFYALNVLNGVINAGFANLPEQTAGGDFEKGSVITVFTLVWRVTYPLLAAFVGGWMLATWVCLYKRSEAGRVHADNWIKY